MEQVLPGWLSAEELVHHRMEAFHRERVRAIVAGEAPFRLKAGPTLVVHLIPLDTVRSRRRFTASELKVHGRTIPPLGEQSGQYRFNAEGYASYDGEGEARSYTQLLRDGRLEAVTAEAGYEQQGAKFLRDSLCERSMAELVGQYLVFCKGIGIPSPIWVFTALAGCEGLRVSTWHGVSGGAIHRPLLFLPEFSLDSLDIAHPDQHLRPLFDCLANAVGYERLAELRRARQSQGAEGVVAASRND